MFIITQFTSVEGKYKIAVIEDSGRLPKELVRTFVEQRVSLCLVLCRRILD